MPSQEKLPVAPKLSKVAGRRPRSLSEPAPDFVAAVGDALARTGLDPSSLELEITESLMIDRSDAVTSRLAELRGWGVKVALDDFGTGYSNLRYLKDLPVDRLKIDKSLMEDVPENKESAAIVRSIIFLAHGLGLRVIVEGVETTQQAEFLACIGCEEAQGFYFSRPLTVQATEMLLSSTSSKMTADGWRR